MNPRCPSLLAALALLAALLPGTPAPTAAPPAGIAVVAHRGAMHELPENTLEAFRRAVELGADVIEVDVRTSRDGTLIVLHDATVDRTTDGSGPASALDWEELRRLDAGAWFDAAHAGKRIPSLAEVLAWAKGRTTVLLDLKEKGPEFARAVSAEVRRSGDPDSVVVGVRSPEQAREFRETLPGSRQLAFMRSPEEIEAFAEAGVDFMRLWLRWTEADPSLPARVRAAGARLMVNGRHGDREEAAALLATEPDWILVDNAPQLLESLAALRGEGR